MGTGQEFSGLHRNGHEICLDIGLRLIASDTETVAVVTISDISKRKQREERVAFAATHDGLTGVANRSLFFDRLRQASARADRSRSNVAVLYLDLDGFKRLNDERGHTYGDRTLKWVANTLKSAVRTTDTVARIGGDEFAIILENVDGRQEVNRIAAKLRAAVRQGTDKKIGECRLDVSIGYALYPKDVTKPGLLLRKADSEMYRTKVLRHRKLFST
jgi:diguanylate cyclase (GGDEF)-like protein